MGSRETVCADAHLSYNVKPDLLEMVLSVSAGAIARRCAVYKMRFKQVRMSRLTVGRCAFRNVTASSNFRV
ncbi:MAG: hypothetical protein AAFY64_03980, partial [Pseudomonadota bacterium]